MLVTSINCMVNCAYKQTPPKKKKKKRRPRLKSRRLIKEGPMVMRRHHGPAQHQPEQAVAGLQCGGVVFCSTARTLCVGDLVGRPARVTPGPKCPRKRRCFFFFWNARCGIYSSGFVTHPFFPRCQTNTAKRAVLKSAHKSCGFFFAFFFLRALRLDLKAHTLCARNGG